MSDKMKEMLEEKKQRNKKEDRKYLVIMLVLFAACLVGGYGAGRLIGKVKKMDIDFSSTIESIKEVAVYAVPIIVVVLNLILAIVAALVIRKSKILFATWDGEEEELPDKIDNKLGGVLAASGIINIISFFMFAVAVDLDLTMEMSDFMEKAFLLANSGILIFSLVVMIIVQKGIIDMTKLMNPEKNGSIYDVKFSKKWEESCDEAQKLVIYNASHIAYQATGTMCMILWIICIIGDIALEFGIVPVTMVTIIWLTLSISYMFAAGKLEKKNK